ncbi:MAG: solute carrier 26 family protein [bacterium]|nr:solute carrier 26 family protein [bacterium]
MPKSKSIRKHLRPLSKVIWRGRQQSSLNNITRRFSHSKLGGKLLPVTKELGERRVKARFRKVWRRRGKLVSTYLPIWDWGKNYKREDLSGDMMAGMVVAIMLMPQSMAYAMLAGLPPQIGLYTAVLPLIFYAFFGSSRSLGVGPVAIVSLMVAHTLSPLAQTGSPVYIGMALILAMLSSLVLISAGLLRLGFLTNFIGHPVIAGFTTAAAIIIACSQLKHMLGLSLPPTHNLWELLTVIFANLHKVNPTTLLLSLLGVVIMISRAQFRHRLREMGFSEGISMALPKSMALLLVIISATYAWAFSIDQTAGVAIVGTIPPGFPAVSLPSFDYDIWKQLLPAAVLISVVGLVESLSVAKALATRKRQKIDPNQELIGLGTANLGAAMTGGYPVTGSFSRSVVNFTSGNNTQLSAIITAFLIAIVLIFFTPLLYHIPKATLAVIIIVAVTTLIDFSPLVSAWKYYKPDGLAFFVTFIAVLASGVEVGILLGISLSIGMYLYRSSQPRMPVLGRVGKSEHFRSSKRHKTKTYDNLLLIRVDDNLFFANAAYLEDRMLAEIADRPDVKHVVLVMDAVSLIDASALETLEHLIDSYRDAGVLIHLASVKGPLMDMLERSHFLMHLSPGEVFMSPHEAVVELTGEFLQSEKAPKTAPKRKRKTKETPSNGKSPAAARRTEKTTPTN